MPLHKVTTSLIMKAASGGHRSAGHAARPTIIVQVDGYDQDLWLSVEAADELQRSLTHALAKARAIEEL